MSRVFGAPRRAVLVSVIVMFGCLTLLLLSAGLARADQMVASWYGPGFEGATTASGEPFDPSDYTAAHRTLPFGTKLIVTYNGRSVVVRVNDRGPYVSGRDIDLSQAAAEYIGLTAVGEAAVSVETADGSTPTGPYGGASAAPEAPAPQPKAPQPNTQQPTVNVADTVATGGGVDQPVADQPGAADQQYAAKDQYKPEPQAAPAPPPATVASAAPPAPDPSRLETPPAEVDTPGSTVERRIVFLEAAPVAKAPAPEPAPVENVPTPEPAPAAKASPAAKEIPKSQEVAGITVLPDTGGAPLWALAGGALLVGAGALTFFRIKR